MVSGASVGAAVETVGVVSGASVGAAVETVGVVSGASVGAAVETVGVVSGASVGAAVETVGVVSGSVGAAVVSGGVSVVISSDVNSVNASSVAINLLDVTLSVDTVCVVTKTNKNNKKTKTCRFDFIRDYYSVILGCNSAARKLPIKKCLGKNHFQLKSHGESEIARN